MFYGNFEIAPLGRRHLYGCNLDHQWSQCEIHCITQQAIGKEKIDRQEMDKSGTHIASWPRHCVPTAGDTHDPRPSAQKSAVARGASPYRSPLPLPPPGKARSTSTLPCPASTSCPRSHPRAKATNLRLLSVSY